MVINIVNKEIKIKTDYLGLWRTFIISIFLLSFGNNPVLIAQKLKRFDNKCFILNDTLYIAGARKKHPDRIQLFAALKGEKPNVVFPPERIYYSRTFYDGLPWAMGNQYFFFEGRFELLNSLHRRLFFFKRNELKSLRADSYPRPGSTILSTKFYVFNLNHDKNPPNRSDLAIGQDDNIYYLVNNLKGIQIGIHQGDYWKNADFEDKYEHEEQDKWEILGVMDFDIQKAFRAFIVEDEVYVLSIDGIFKAPLNDLEAGRKIVDLTIEPKRRPLWLINFDEKTVYIRHATSLRNLEKGTMKFIPLSEEPEMQKWVKRSLRK